MPLPILPALIAGAAYLIYSGFREEGPVATPNPHAGAKRAGRPKGAKAKPKANVPRETSPKTGTTPKSEAAPKPKPTPKPKPKTEPKPAPKPEPKPEPEPRRGGTMPKPEPEPKEVTDDVPRETSDSDS